MRKRKTSNKTGKPQDEGAGTAPAQQQQQTPSSSSGATPTSKPPPPEPLELWWLLLCRSLGSRSVLGQLR